MSPLGQIAALHGKHEEPEYDREGSYTWECGSFTCCNECSGRGVVSYLGWPCETWVLATQTPAVAETWRVLVKDRDPQAALEQAQALERD